MFKSKLVYVLWALLVATGVAMALVSVHAGDAGGGGGANMIFPFLV